MKPLRLQRILAWIAGVALVVAIGMRVLPATARATPLAPTVPPMHEPVGAPMLASDAAEAIVLSNVFAASRSAPARRFVPPELVNETATGMVAPEDSSVIAPFVDTLTEAEPRLLGTVIDPGGPRALIQFGASTPTARLLSVGDRVDGWRVLSVEPGRVVLRGPNGRVTLRLVPENRP